MKTIIFKTNEYELKDAPNVSISRLQASLVNEYSIDSLLTELEDIGTITVKEDDEIIGVYNGYTTLVAVSVYGDVISVELDNHDIQSQINALSTELTQVENTQETHDMAINNLGEATSGLAEQNTTQDLAIEDLAEAVSELTPEEG